MEFIKTWAEVQRSKEYKSLSAAGKKAAKRQYPFKKEESLIREKMHSSMVSAIEGLNKSIGCIKPESDTKELNKIIKCLESLETQMANIKIEAPESNNNLEWLFDDLKNQLMNNNNEKVTAWDVDYIRDSEGYTKKLELRAVGYTLDS